MRLESSELLLSATDVGSHLACRHRTELDRRLAEGRIAAPARRDPLAEALAERGLAHERAYLEFLRAERGLEVLEIGGEGSREEALERARAAMRAGVAAIAQAPLADGRWHGRADVLLRVERPSALGGFSYEVVDTKLASETRGETVLQLCLYSELVGRVQGSVPDAMYVVAPGGYAAPERFRTCDFLAYYRLVRGKLEAAVAAAGDGEPPTYPEPVPHCDVCRWWHGCNQRRRADDHLSFVAGLSRLQQRELRRSGVGTLSALAAAKLPLEPRPARGAPEGYERAHHQARLQRASRDEPAPLHELLLPALPDRGLARLPEPSPGDVFLDLEGDPFVEGGGREYLFGWVASGEGGAPEYHRLWALDPAAERRAFEALIDELLARWERDPGLHVFHFGIYEPGAMKRLMGRYGTRGEELDRLLRAERFVDLHAVVRQGLRVGVEHYSLKHLEPLHGFERALELRTASAWLHGVERALELGDPSSILPEARAAVESYNRDDCLSTLGLRDWLERVRGGALEQGALLPRPAPKEGLPSEEVGEAERRIQALFERLTRDVPAGPAARSEAERARWLLAHLLEFHRREDKATWWEYFRLAALSAVQLFEEKAALAGLELVGEVGGTPAAPIHRYRFPAQDHDLRRGQALRAEGGSRLGGIEEIDLAGRTLDVKKRRDTRDLHPPAAFAHDHVPPGPLPAALEDFAGWVAEHGVDAPGAHRAARDLLLGRPPRLPPGTPLRREGEELLDSARRLAVALDGGVLPVQGPPGSGKTFLGARMICALVRAGRKVGVTAVSHKVIRNLLEETLRAAQEEGVDLHCLQKVSDGSGEPADGIEETGDNGELLGALQGGEAPVGAGTVWVWARPDFEGSVDVLVVDEAGQMSLANALAAARSARSVILLGDPQQLEQPVQGAHPEGADVSALEHLLGGHETLPPERGLFLDETWRLHPAICAFTSELFYESRLLARAGCEGQALTGPTPFAGAGLWLLAVPHEGNQSSAPEEVAAVATVVGALLRAGVGWIDRKGEPAPLTLQDILIVAPYNAQVAALKARLPGARIGTVDLFQGQEAPVVIYSATTSSAEEAPRGMDFLYSLHRLNVATSRARCACILLASPRLLEPECRTPHQMRLANALCRYAELARRAPAL